MTEKSEDNGDDKVKLENPLIAETNYNLNQIGADSIDKKENKMNIKFIGFMKSVFKNKNATPHQSNGCEEFKGKIEIDRKLFNNPHHSLEGLMEFSHVWIIFIFHENNNQFTKAKVKPPRLDGAKVGVFATRSPYRPNPIGLTLAKLDAVIDSTIYLSGIDIIDGTPIIDIKPYIESYDNVRNQITRTNGCEGDLGEKKDSSNFVKIPQWIRNANENKLHVRFTNWAENELKQLKINEFENVKQALENVLLNDPRSAYRRQRCSDRMYYFTFDDLHITAWFDEKQVEIVKVKKINDAS